jgi:hypothetical protein
VFFGVSCWLKMQCECLDTYLAMIHGVYSLWGRVSDSVDSFERMTEACVLKHAHTYNDPIILLSALHTVNQSEQLCMLAL